MFCTWPAGFRSGGVNQNCIRWCAWCLLSAFAIGSGLVAAATWGPDKTVEIVIPSGPASGTDTIGREMQNVLAAKKFVQVSMLAVNKAGGGGALGLYYLNQHPKDGHFLYVTSPTFLTSIITGTVTAKYTDVTPLAQLFNEYVVLFAAPDSKIRDARDLMERLRRDPASISIGLATALGNANHIAVASAVRAAGGDPKQLKIVVFKSGGEGLAATLGGHVDINVIGAVAVIPYLQSGKLKPLAITSPKRLGGALASVPTLVEQGINSVSGQWRGIVGPKGMTELQIDYWDRVFFQLAKTDEWTSLLEANAWSGTYMNSAESKKFLEAEFQELKTTLTHLGLAK